MKTRVRNLEAAAPLSPDKGSASYGKIANLIIRHPNFSRALREIRTVLDLGVHDDEAPCLHVSGPPGVGKSTLSKILRTEYAPVRDGRTVLLPKAPEMIADHFPLLRFEIPTNPTVKTVCYEILKVFKDPNWYRGDEYSLGDRVDRYIKACGTVALLADEAERMVDRDGVVVAEHLVEWFKSRHGENGVALIFSGQGRLRHLIEQDAHIERRWGAEIRLEPYRWKLPDGSDAEDEQDNFMGLLAAFRDESTVPFGVNVADDQVAFRFYYASRGVIGFLKKLLKYVYLVILEDPKRYHEVSMKVLSEAFDRAFRIQRHQLENPFEPKFGFKLPPPLDDDSLLRPTQKVRRQRKSKLIKNAELISRLRKS